jgi:hypothetical protein
VQKEPASRARRSLGPAITWIPAHDSYYVMARILSDSTGLPDLRVTQPALLELQRQINEARMTLPYGLLAGQRCLAPGTGVEYLLVDDITPARRELTESDLRSQLKSELRSLSSSAGRRGKLAFGWYVSGLGEELQLDGEDLSLHREMFPDPWQVVLLHDNSSGLERGAFVRYSSMTNRSYALPFFEVLADAVPDVDEARTALQWTNYRSLEPVTPLDKNDIARLIGVGSLASTKKSRLWDWLSSRRINDAPHDRAAEHVPRPTDDAFPNRNEIGAPGAAPNQSLRLPHVPPIASTADQPEISERVVFIDGQLAVYSAQTPPDTNANQRPSLLRRVGLAFAGALVLALLVLFGLRLSA